MPGEAERVEDRHGQRGNDKLQRAVAHGPRAHVVVVGHEHVRPVVDLLLVSGFVAVQERRVVLVLYDGPEAFVLSLKLVGGGGGGGGERAEKGCNFELKLLSQHVDHNCYCENIRKYIYTYIHIFIHIYIHTNIHTYIHT